MNVIEHLSTASPRCRTRPWGLVFACFVSRHTHARWHSGAPHSRRRGVPWVVDVPTKFLRKSVGGLEMVKRDLTLYLDYMYYSCPTMV